MDSLTYMQVSADKVAGRLCEDTRDEGTRHEHDREENELYLASNVFVRCTPCKTRLCMLRHHAHSVKLVIRNDEHRTQGNDDTLRTHQELLKRVSVYLRRTILNSNLAEEHPCQRAHENTLHEDYCQKMNTARKNSVLNRILQTNEDNDRNVALM